MLITTLRVNRVEDIHKFNERAIELPELLPLIRQQTPTNYIETTVISPPHLNLLQQLLCSTALHIRQYGPNIPHPWLTVDYIYSHLTLMVHHLISRSHHFLINSVPRNKTLLSNSLNLLTLPSCPHPPHLTHLILHHIPPPLAHLPPHLHLQHDQIIHL